MWLSRAPAAKRLKVALGQVAGKTGLQPPHLCLQVSSGAAPSPPRCDGELMGPRIGAGKSMACFWSETCFSFWPRKFRGMLLFYLCFLEEPPYKLQGPTNPTLTYSLIGWRCSSWGIYIRGPSKNNILSYVFRLGVQYSIYSNSNSKEASTELWQQSWIYSKTTIWFYLRINYSVLFDFYYYYLNDGFSNNTRSNKLHL